MVHAIYETENFVRGAKAAGMDEEERDELITFLALHPQAGDLIFGTGGARKLRWKRPGTGKSGGYRVITYFAGLDMPVFLLSIYAKGDQANLSQADRNAIRQAVPILVSRYRERRQR